MNAQLTAGLTVLDELYDDLIAAIRPLDEASLNWKPPVSEANSIAALVRHIAGSRDSWLTRALGAPVSRDRDAEFGYRGSAGDLIALIEQSRRSVCLQFERLDAINPATIRRYRRLGHDEESALSVAWCVEHALLHAAEHWGQIQLNRQLSAIGGG
jgi:uncharacterized damage-inducible protein DinB